MGPPLMGSSFRSLSSILEQNEIIEIITIHNDLGYFRYVDDILME
jgi:hypothetical protein